MRNGALKTARLARRNGTALRKTTSKSDAPYSGFFGIEFTDLGKWDVESNFRPLELSGEEKALLKSVGCRAA
jgi:hypothetical protein